MATAPPADFEAFISDLKSKVNKMLDERRRLDSNETINPSPIWSDSVSVWRYLMTMSAEDFRNIRFHQGNPWRYWHMSPAPDPHTAARDFGYLDAIRGVPEKYWLGEPRFPGIPGPLGIEWLGRIINGDVVRYQQCVSNLYSYGVIEALTGSDHKSIVLEIGATWLTFLATGWRAQVACHRARAAVEHLPTSHTAPIKKIARRQTSGLSSPPQL